jgi:hypothetical protein
LPRQHGILPNRGVYFRLAKEQVGVVAKDVGRFLRGISSFVKPRESASDFLLVVGNPADDRPEIEPVLCIHCSPRFGLLHVVFGDLA